MRRRRAGVAMVVALCFMVLCQVLAMTLITVGRTELMKSENHDRGVKARLAAESGVEMMVLYMRNIRLPIGQSIENSVLSLRYALQEKLGDMPAFEGQIVQLETTELGTGVYVPKVVMNDGQWFETWIAPASDTHLKMKVAGWAGGICRAVTIDLDLEAKLPLIFEYGLASKGQIYLSGKTQVLHNTDRSEANIFSATSTIPTAVYLSGSGVVVGGDVFLANEYEHVMIEGSPSIGGSTTESEIPDHIHADMDTPDFPEVDTTDLVAFATNTLTTSTPPSGTTYTNIRIPAGTNPTFGADVVLNGVVYVEAPNTVAFEGHATVNAIIVTQQNSEPLENCSLRFAGTLDANGVGGLPDTEEFADIRTRTGTFIVAPDFSVEFAGAFETINGHIAAGQVLFGGGASGTITGTVVAFEDIPEALSIEGSVQVSLNRANQDQNPAGFKKSLAPVAEPDTYREMKRRADWK